MAKAKEESKKPDWLKMKPAEVEKLVIELAKKGESPSKIGLILRDQHGIPKTKLVAAKKIVQILRENNLSPRPDRENTADQVKNLEKHIALHKHDSSANRAVIKKLWVINRQ